MRKFPIFRSSLLTLSLAVMTAGALSGCTREMAVRGDPRVDGLIPQMPATPDPDILADPRTLKGNRPATPPGGTTTGTQPGPEAGPADTTPYDIKLNRPAIAGMTYDTQINLEQTVTNAITPPGAASAMVDTKTIKLELAGRVAVGAVDENGNPKDFTLTVSKLNLGGKEAVAANKVINAKLDKTYAFTVGNEAVSDDLKEALNLAFDAGSESDDAAFGSKTQHKAGDSWPLNAEAAAKGIDKEGTVSVDPKNISGQATLKGVETVKGNKALRVEATMTAKDLKVNDPSVTMDSSDFKAVFGALLPVDATQPPLETTEAMDMAMHVSAPAKVDTTMHMTKKETITVVK